MNTVIIKKPHLKKIRGYTLIEMLIALLVLSVGLLGVAALQTTGQQFNYRSYIRTQTAILAADLADRMRANRSVAASGGYKSENQAGKLDTSCEEGTCTPGQLAVYDLNNWFYKLTTSLPDAQATITLAGANVYTLVLQWQEDQSPDATPKQQQWRIQL